MNEITNFLKSLSTGEIIAIIGVFIALIAAVYTVFGYYKKSDRNIQKSEGNNSPNINTSGKVKITYGNSKQD